MSKTLFKLRIFGIVTFLLYFLFEMFRFPTNTGFYFNQIQGILALVSFVIFAILILLQVYGFYLNNFVREKEHDDSSLIP